MKKIFLSLLFLASTFAFADETQVLRVFDGSTAQCKTKADQFRFAAGVYRVVNPKVSVKNDVATVRLTLEGFKCVRTFTGFRFVPASVLAKKEYFALDGTLTTITVLEAELVAMTDGVYNILSQRKLKDAAVQTVTMKVETADLQRLNGQYVLDVFMRAKNRIQNIERDFDETTRVGFGSFRIKF